MATNPNDSVNHIPYSGSSIGNGDIGITKREYFAAMAMSSLDVKSVFLDVNLERIIAESAVRISDALIAELNKEVKDVPK